MSLNVIDFERKYDPKKYYVYTIKISWKNNSRLVKFRYSKLREFYERLIATFPEAVFPSFPDKIIFGILSFFFSFFFLLIQNKKSKSNENKGRSHIQHVTEVRMRCLNQFFEVKFVHFFFKKKK